MVIARQAEREPVPVSFHGGLSEDALEDIVSHLATRPGHDAVKGQLYELLVVGLGADRSLIDFEKKVPEAQGRIDALLGRTVFEIKRDMGRERGDAENQLARYLPEREANTGQPFVGIATDGLDWRAYECRNGYLVELSILKVDPKKPWQLLSWLDGAAALKAELPTDAATLKQELGRESVAFRHAAAELAGLWNAARSDRSVVLKRQLWQQLLALIYGKSVESDELWYQHTYLVVIAKAIASRVLDLPVNDPQRMLEGTSFSAAGILGAVESDFFDWVLAAPQGARFVRRLAAHVSRFRWHVAETDVMRVLYEALIDRDQRKNLGEYYTPDWLAAKVVREAVKEPLTQRVLDPSCGSGTFLFHAVRAYRRAADAANVPLPEQASRASGLIAGMDLHPVAVIIARVTYILALGPAAGARAGSISIPVYVGESLQLDVTSILTGRELGIRVPAPPEGGNPDFLRFPEGICSQPNLLDMVVERMTRSSDVGHAPGQFRAAIAQIGVAPADLPEIENTYQRFHALRKAGRDTIWPYVARNLARPLYFSVVARADVLVGNPPWLAFRHMSRELQERFKELARGENIHVGGKLATQNDLCALFVARAVDLYLKVGGSFAFVLPHAVLTRGQFEPFRKGSFRGKKVQYTAAWELDDAVDPLFPVPSCVVFGTARQGLNRPLPGRVTRFEGRLPHRDATEALADEVLTVTDADAPREASYAEGSPYRKLFRNGATLFPRLLCLVERVQTGRLGVNASCPVVRSRRSSQEKEPWKSLPGIEAAVEAPFIRPVLLGESILPYRVFRPFEGVVPALEDGTVLDAAGAAVRGFSGLEDWLRAAEGLWERNGEGRITLLEQLNYYGKLQEQFPLAASRVVYAKAGTLPAACIVKDKKTVIDHKLYWMDSFDDQEINYLCSILNSETGRKRIEALQSKGQWGARDFDKVVFTLPIPRFDARLSLHADLATAAGEATAIAAAVELPEEMNFQKARRAVRDALAEAGVDARIDALVERLLDD